MPALLPPRPAPPAATAAPATSAGVAGHPLDRFPALNEAQRQAVLHSGGPLLVIAGAGSGKTLTLAARVARLVLEGADPNRLLLLSFSRRAAAELQRRAGQMLHQALGLRSSQPAPHLPWAGTFHSLGARLLRLHAAEAGLPEDFSIIDRPDAEELMGWQRQALGLAGRSQRAPLPGTCLAIYSRVLNSQGELSDLLGQAFPWCLGWEPELKSLFTAYEQAKRDQHLLDYDDLLLEWAALMQQPGMAAQLGLQFQQVLVDEYQDTNRLQAGILQALKPDGQGLTVVGDDAQSIYSFRAAEVRNILDFPQQFCPPARVVTLERNYRSTQPLLAAANAVIALAAERHAKTLWSDRASSVRPLLVAVEDESAQARWVADEVLAQREAGLRLKSQAVLFRTSHHSAALELELARRNIPFVKFGGLKFLEAAHVKDVLALLRWVQNPHCRLAGFRVARLLPGMGPASAQRLMLALAEAGSEGPDAALLAFVPPPAAAVEWAALLALLQSLRAAGPAGWPAEIDQVLAWYAPQLQRLHEHPQARQMDLDQLSAMARGHSSRERFLTDMALDPPEASSDEAGQPLLDEDYLILSTLHAAKGQEWSSVMLLNVVDGCLPGDLATGSPQQLEEERRLLYVGMTRARQHLALMVPQRFHVTQQARHGGRHLYAGRSRFLPAELLPLFEQRHPAPPPEAARWGGVSGSLGAGGQGVGVPGPTPPEAQALNRAEAPQRRPPPGARWR